MKFPEAYRIQRPGYETQAGSPFGMFMLKSYQAKGRTLAIIACDGEETGWEHVSVSLPDHRKHCPSWDEMCLVKSLFWEPGECVVQFHPAEKDYVNMHGGCLHLWKCVHSPFPTPPTILV